MFKSILSKLVLIVGGLLIFPHLASAQNSLHVPGELLIAPKAGVSDAQLESIYKSHGAQKITTLTQIGVHHIKVPDNALEAIEAALRKNPSVQFVEKNFIAEANLVPNDPGYGSQWHLQTISAPAGWDITVGSPAVTVAVIDSGVDPAHPDLVAKLVPGWNFLGSNTDTHDVLGHGTAVAGVTAADTNDGIGVAGVGWANTIMPLVVVNSSNSATYADIASAVNYAADHGAKVINMSLGGTSSSSTLQSAVNYAWSKGLVIVAAAGNCSCSTPSYPAAMNNVVAVSATDSSDNLASFSSFGSFVDVAAPGTPIYTTNNGGGYGNWQGTSFSSPQVAGLAALIFSLNPGLSNTQVVDLITQNVDDLGAAGFDQYFGWGRINVGRTLQAAYSTSPLSVAITSPSDGSTVSGTVNVNVAASSSIGVSKVDLYMDGILAATNSVAPYSFSWNTTGLSGAHTLVTKAYDVVGSVATSLPVTVTIGSGGSTTPSDTTPPSVSITNIAYDGKFLMIAVSASDTQSGVAKVELYVDGALKSTDTAAPWSFKLNARPLGKGSHTIQAKAYDGAGNASVSSSATTTTN